MLKVDSIILILTCLSVLVSCEFIKNVFGLTPKTHNTKTISNKGKKMNFLKINGKKDGVTTTDSGLQYKVIKEGTGSSPTAKDKVEVHYRGTLVDGTEFDSSYSRNQSIVFGLNQVIAGWTEGLQLMKEGATYELYIPSNLAYGNRALPGIPANSTLIFQVELIKVL